VASLSSNELSSSDANVVNSTETITGIPNAGTLLNEEDSLPPLEIEKTKAPSVSTVLRERRIVDLGYVLTQYEKILQHNRNCTMGKMQLTKEKREGLSYALYFSCSHCDKTAILLSEPPEQKKNAINEKAVWGCLAIGIGHSQCEELLGILDIPFMHQQTAVKELSLQKEIHTLPEPTLLRWHIPTDLAGILVYAKEVHVTQQRLGYLRSVDCINWSKEIKARKVDIHGEKGTLTILTMDQIINNDEVIDMELQTRGQHDNNFWKEMCRNRLTASNFGSIMSLKDWTLCSKTVERLLYSKEIFTKSILFSRIHEETAAELYEKAKGIQTSKCGLFIHPSHPFLGASPDRLINDGRGILEIKCLPSVGENKLKNTRLKGACYKIE
ncbi:hypothetical protein ILUMI_19329, partial [Ignelater luminosus]